MPWLIDGSNLLGVMHVDRLSAESKRSLVRMLGAFARVKKTRVACIFDGPEPPLWGRVPGNVSVVFAGARTGDDVIIERAGNGRGWSVVTNDRELAARVARRQVEIIAPAVFLREMEEAAANDTEAAGGDDWSAYFADPKNKLDF